MKDLWYIATESFNKSHDGWKDFVEWSKLTQVNEIVSLDISLCPNLINDPTEEDWRHFVEEYENCCFFKELNYLMERTREFKNKNILALVYKPVMEEKGREVNEFIFAGYDLVEEFSGISALTNCGGFDKAFHNEELNSFGILDTFARATKVQTALQEQYPEESHAETEIWAIWRFKSYDTVCDF